MTTTALAKTLAAEPDSSDSKSLESLCDLIANNEEWLIHKILDYAKVTGYSKYAPTLAEDWRMSISALSESLIAALRTNGTNFELNPDEDYTQDPVASFGVIEAKRHMERGVSLAVSLGLMKYCRQSYKDLVLHADFERPHEALFCVAIERFFDRLEIGSCSEWTSSASRAGKEELFRARKMESIGVLAGGVAHAFNNLLTAIEWNTSLLRKSVDPAGPRYRAIEKIEEEVRSGARLTARLLDCASGGDYEATPIDLNRLLEDTSETFRRTRKGTVVHLELEKDLWTVEADRGRLEQVLWNLYVNAADAMPEGGRLSLTTRNIASSGPGKSNEARADNHVLLQVTDTGTGMDATILEHIFEPFFTTKGKLGTGLGLASVYGIVKQHGGHIEVESAPGQGATFSIYLPAEREAVPLGIEAPQRVTDRASTILFVDDEEMVLEVGVEVLSQAGCRVLEARNGSEAIKVYEENQDKIDIVILDMVMPDIGGGEVFDRIRAINPTAKVLLHTGYTAKGEAAEILARGCNGFIQKPCRTRDLLAKIEDVLNQG